MKRLWRLRAASLIVAAAILPAQAAGRPGADPDWPCPQPKVADFPLASVWDGPAIDMNTKGWRDDAETADLVAVLSQRRAPIADVEAAVAKLAASGKPDSKDELKIAFGAAFAELTRQRAEIIAGLDRFGRKQREMAERIRAENESAHLAAAPDDAALQKLRWDLRVYDDRRQTIHYVCEAPQAIEARIGAIVRFIRPAL